MKKRIVTLLAFTTITASLVFGQPSNATPTAPTTAQIVANLVQRLTTLLTLTTAQQTQATTIYTTEQTALSTLGTSRQTAQTALQTAIKANDLTGISTQATQIGNLTTQQVEDEANAEAAFYAILTADQQTKYNQLHSVGLGGRGGPRGGFAGRGLGGVGTRP
ncbi:MAG TPA: Spy/CpxP family protein refolding chaperone [Bryobacteraceae bacterium]|jgi:Spy/CpxP family protein refolding chaperone|nr:Spy/CpxP family protein refolding chaperone [Bryobacteraceae bacterium]